MIEHRVEIENNVFANTVADAETIQAMYPAGLTDAVETYVTSFEPPIEGKTLNGFNSVLRYQELPDGRMAILGNTKTGICGVAKDCGNCALANSGLTVQEMSARNCARANTAGAYEKSGQTEPEGRFVLLPTSKDAIVVSDDNFVEERNNGELMQNRVKAAACIVFTEDWVRRSKEITQLSPSMNGADGSMGVALPTIRGEEVYMAFCSMRGNMGDRGEADQILRQGLNAYREHKGFSDEEWADILSTLEIPIYLSASASLANFAHKIQVPSEAEDAPAPQRKYAASLREKYPDLVARAGDKITSAIVLNDQYPGAMGRGSIFPELEAKMGIHVTPISPDNCPGDGQSCHIDYRSETEYALTTQLEQMGVRAENIRYYDTQALDPASPDNKMASNRAEQNNGVAVAMTNRTLNGVTISFGN